MKNRKLWPGIVVLLFAGLGLSGFGGEAPKIYTNSDGSVISKSLLEVLRWRLSSWGERGDKEVAAPDFPLVRDERVLSGKGLPRYGVSWVGHATALLFLNGHTVITDPMFSGRASPVSWAGPKPWVPPPYALSELPHVDVVVISHNHYDHLDLPSLQALAKQAGGPPLFLVPPGVSALLIESGIAPVREVSWWNRLTDNGLTITAVPAHHWSARGLGDRNQTHWGGWVVNDGTVRVYFAGDTGYSQDFAEIGARLGPFDLALIPVGAYAPRDFMRDQHVDPEEAVKIHREVRSRRSVGIHWGTFPLADEGPQAPVRDLEAAKTAAGLAADEFVLLKHGEVLTLQPAGQVAVPAR